ADGFAPMTLVTTLEDYGIADLLPGSGVRATATLGNCLEGASSPVVDPGDQVLDVPLVAVHPAKVRVQVWDPDGNPLPAANGCGRGEDRCCAPPMATGVDVTGGVASAIGVGPAHLLVTAPEHEGHEADYEFARGDDRVIN